MNFVFIDTSFLIAIIRKKDELHDCALGWQKVVTSSLLTTEYILVELVDSLGSEPFRRPVLNVVKELREDKEVRIVRASTALLDEGLSFFGGHADKEWSLTDCISFLVMRREGVLNALTSDHHFEQAGFRALLRSDPSEYPKGQGR